MKIKKIVGWFSGILSIIIILIMYIFFPLDKEGVFFSVNNSILYINLLPIFLLTVGIICMFICVKCIGVKKE